MYKCMRVICIKKDLGFLVYQKIYNGKLGIYHSYEIDNHLYPRVCGL